MRNESAPAPRDGVRIGLVELFVHPLRAADKLTAIRGAIRRDAHARRAKVLASLRDPRSRALDLLVFPGWTLCGTEVDDEIVGACGDRVVVLEVLHARPEKKDAFPWTTYAIDAGAVVATARQSLATAAEVTPDRRDALCTELGQGGARRFRSRRLGDVGIVVCGEANAQPMSGRALVPDLDVIVNPAHTPSRLEAMRKKRERLSAGRLVVSTANTHDAWTRSDGEAMQRGTTAAEWFARGKRRVLPEPIAIAEGVTLRAVTFARRS
jgi:hypothetical protein